MRIVAAAARYLVLIVTATLFLLPFYLIVRNGLATDREITAPGWTFLPHRPRWSNLAELFDDPQVPMARALVNSAVVAVLQTAGQLLLGSMAGYGLARIPYRHAGKVFGAILVTLMIPAAVTFVPTFVLVSSLGWVSSLRGLIVPGLFSGFTAFMFRQYFLTFPAELEEAARLDGLDYFGAYWRVVVPNTKQIFAALGALNLVASWNAFLWPLVIGQDRDSWTVQVALSTFITAQSINLHELFVAAAASILPLVLAFLLLQRHLIRGVAETGLRD